MTRSVTELMEKLDLVLKKITDIEEKLNQHQPKAAHHISTQTEDVTCRRSTRLLRSALVLLIMMLIPFGCSLLRVS